jgi:hypothetical protein
VSYYVCKQSLSIKKSDTVSIVSSEIKLSQFDYQILLIHQQVYEYLRLLQSESFFKSKNKHSLAKYKFSVMSYHNRSYFFATMRGQLIITFHQKNVKNIHKKEEGKKVFFTQIDKERNPHTFHFLRR